MLPKQKAKIDFSDLGVEPVGMSINDEEFGRELEAMFEKFRKMHKEFAAKGAAGTDAESSDGPLAPVRVNKGDAYYKKADKLYSQYYELMAKRARLPKMLDTQKYQQLLGNTARYLALMVGHAVHHLEEQAAGREEDNGEKREPDAN